MMANDGFMSYFSILDYEKGLVKCDGVGFGMVLIKMEVFKKLKMPYFEYSDQYGEDLHFCNDATTAGFEIFCDTNLVLGHIGNPPVIREEHYNSEREGAKLFDEQKMEECKRKAEEVSLKADIVIPCYKELEVTKTCVESILNNTAGVDIRLVIVNDGAFPPLKRYVARLKKYWKNIVYVESKKQLGASGATNLGLKNCERAFVVLMNNDTEVLPHMNNWLFKFIQKLALDPELGAVGPVSNFIFGIQQTAYSAQFAMPEHYTKVLIPLCMCIKREVINKVGLFDEQFTMENKIGLNQDLDYSIRIREAGYKMKILRDVFIQHIGEQTQKKLGSTKEAEEKTRKLLEKKWGEAKVLDAVHLPITKMDREFLLKGE
jgi:GT2 family glycosyltransferase